MQLKQDNTLLKYNNTYHDTIKLKTVDVNPNTYIDYNEEKNDKAPKFEIGDHVRILKHKSISAKKYTPNLSVEVLGIKKVKSSVPWTYVISDRNGEEIVGIFTNKNCKKQVKKNLDQKDYLREKIINYMSNGKVMIIHLIVGLIKKIQIHKMSYFPDRYNYSKSKLKVGLNLSNCARRCVNTSDFTKKADAAS